MFHANGTGSSVHCSSWLSQACRARSDRDGENVTEDDELIGLGTFPIEAGPVYHALLGMALANAAGQPLWKRYNPRRRTLARRP